jgi:hypothetical protein
MTQCLETLAMCQVSNRYARADGDEYTTPVWRFSSVTLLPSSHVVIVAVPPLITVTRVKKNRSLPAGIRWSPPEGDDRIRKMNERLAGHVHRYRGGQSPPVVRPVPHDLRFAEPLYDLGLRRIRWQRCSEHHRLWADTDRLLRSTARRS